MTYNCGTLSGRKCDSVSFITEGHGTYCEKCLWNFPSVKSFKIKILAKKGIVTTRPATKYKQFIKSDAERKLLEKYKKPSCADRKQINKELYKKRAEIKRQIEQELQ